VLLLRHALAALLDDRTHGKPHYVGVWARRVRRPGTSNYEKCLGSV
jgi:hypothetical protein